MIQTEPSDTQSILKKRALLYARELKREEEETDQLTILEFHLGSEKYGIESNYVNRVHLLKDLTFLPGIPAFIRGIINVHGKITPVIDIKKFFEIPEQTQAQSDKVIIVTLDGAWFGLLADDVLGLSLVPVSSIQSSLPTLSGVREAYLKGVTDDQVVILDPREWLKDKSLLVHEGGSPGG